MFCFMLRLRFSATPEHAATLFLRVYVCFEAYADFDAALFCRYALITLRPISMIRPATMMSAMMPRH